MAKSLDPEEITVVQSAGQVSFEHDNSFPGARDDSDSDDSGGKDADVHWMNRDWPQDDTD
ncbi:hypothetical protein [Kitasatospora purpeofusca]|uniref:hypothetical protein n=1 Tax=Kitasatospora purpeofusca TaxID=67352 RepID=UPI00386E9314